MRLISLSRLPRPAVILDATLSTISVSRDRTSILEDRKSTDSVVAARSPKSHHSVICQRCVMPMHATSLCCTLYHEAGVVQRYSVSCGSLFLAVLLMNPPKLGVHIFPDPPSLPLPLLACTIPFSINSQVSNNKQKDSSSLQILKSEAINMQAQR